MNAYLTLINAFRATHRSCEAPTHIEYTVTRAVCHHCGITTQAIQDARLDIPAVIATHCRCPAPARPVIAPLLPACPICSRLLNLSTRMSGDTILCTCNANLLVQFSADGARLTLIGQVPATRGRKRR